MNTNRYYFSNFIEDDDLSILAVHAKDVLQKNDTIVKIFEINNEILFGNSPRQVLFLMRQNNKSVFSSSQRNENTSSDARYYEGLSTPVLRNLEIPNKPRRHLPLDDAEKEVSDSGILYPHTPFRRQTVMVSHKNEQLSSPSEASKKESPRSAEIARMAGSLNIAEKKLKSPAKVGGNFDLENQKSPQSAEITRINPSLTEDDKKSRELVGDDHISDDSLTRADFPNPEGNADNFVDPELINQDSIICVEETMKSSKPTIFESEIPSPIKRSKICSIPALDIQKFESPAEKVEIGDSLPENTQPIVNPIHGDKINTLPNEANEGIVWGDVKRKSPSPRKKSILHFRSIPRVIQSTVESESEIDIEGLDDLEDNVDPSSSPADIGSGDMKDFLTSFVASGSKTDTSPGGLERYLRLSETAIPLKYYLSTPGTDNQGSGSSSAEIGSGAIKDILKSPVASGSKTDTSPSILERYLRLSETAHTIPVKYYLSTPGTDSQGSENLAAEIGSGAIKDILKSPVASGSKTDTSSGRLERYLRLPGRAHTHTHAHTHTTPVQYYPSTSETESPDSDDDDVSSEKYFSSNTATESRDLSDKFEYTSSDIESEALSLNQTILQFQMLLDLRHRVMQRIFRSLLSFQESIDFLNSYTYNLSSTLLKIGFSDKEYSTKELKDFANDASGVILKIRKKLQSWKTDVDSDVDAWNNYLQQIQQLKLQYEPLVTNEGKPAVTFELLQVYEFEMKAIWKRLDEMVMVGDSRRALFSNIAHDVEKIIKMFVKCLILVGILLPR